MDVATRLAILATFATTLAVFAADLAAFATTLAALAAILATFAASTRPENPANRLECRAGTENTPDTKSKSGKNGNVDCHSQLYRRSRVAPSPSSTSGMMGRCGACIARRFARKGHAPPRVLPAWRPLESLEARSRRPAWRGTLIRVCAVLAHSRGRAHALRLARRIPDEPESVSAPHWRAATPL
jgi:uncharacterized low-complexity protein